MNCNQLKIILVQGLCPLKIEIARFPIGFRLWVTTFRVKDDRQRKLTPKPFLEVQKFFFESVPSIDRDFSNKQGTCAQKVPTFLIKAALQRAYSWTIRCLFFFSSGSRPERWRAGQVETLTITTDDLFLFASLFFNACRFSVLLDTWRHGMWRVVRLSTVHSLTLTRKKKQLHFSRAFVHSGNLVPKAGAC